MKTLITLLLMSSMAYSQVSFDLGFITRGPSVTAGVNYQQHFLQGTYSPVGLYAAAGMSLAADNLYPTTSLMAGVGTNKLYDPCEWLHGNIILSVGAYWHTGVWTDEKLVRSNKVKPGWSIEYQHFYQMPIKLAWDGKTAHLTFGWVL